MTNALAGETSPYLRQHMDNPVDWLPWGPEAHRRAIELDRPLLVSIGYSACHWCHVMEHESFEDPETAALMNANFVCVKVDREERPDVDAIYMEAVQNMTGQGGWPLNVFLTPDADPLLRRHLLPARPPPRPAELAAGARCDRQDLARATRRRRHLRRPARPAGRRRRPARSLGRADRRSPARRGGREPPPKL